MGFTLLSVARSGQSDNRVKTPVAGITIPLGFFQPREAMDKTSHVNHETKNVMFYVEFDGHFIRKEVMSSE